MPRTPNAPLLAAPLLALLLLVSGCGETPFTQPTQLPDLTSADAPPRDLAPAPDASSAADLARPVDLADSRDLSTPLDLALPPDLSVPLDLSTPLPDLTILPDFSPPPDLTTLPDFADACDPNAGFIGAPDPMQPGGQRVFDSKGYLYYYSYGNDLCRVPPGGGTIEVLVSRVGANNNGAAGSVYVEQGDTVLMQGRQRVIRYNPANKNIATFVAIPDDNYGLSILQDAKGRIIVTRHGLVFDANAKQLGAIPWAGDYIALTSNWVYRQSQTTIDRLCFDGSGRTTYSTGFMDGYGLAVGGDGSLYFGQGNTNPSTIYRVAPGGGPAKALITVPMNVTGVEADPGGNAIYVSGYGDGDTVWKIDTAKVTRVVYGCDPNSMRKCGDTM